MTASGPKSLPALGFLTVIEQAAMGLLGGYLILNAAGRPLEFHCTAPVRPNRAQEILYGPTLFPYLYGEQIGQTLLGRARSVPVVVFTDAAPALAARQFVDRPMVLVWGGEATAAGHEDATAVDRAGQVRRESGSLVQFDLAGHALAVCAAHPDDRRRVIDAWTPYAEGFDLLEPFGRIREALREAQRPPQAA